MCEEKVYYMTAGSGYAFYGCTGLKTVSFSANVNSVQNHAFGRCSSLTNVYFFGMEEEWDKISIGTYGNEKLTSASLHFTKYPEEKEIGYEVSWALKKKDAYASKNKEFVTVPLESTLTMNYTPKESSRQYYVKIRKCTKYKESGDTIYGDWSPVVSVSLTGIVTAVEVETAVKNFVDAMENFTKQLNLASKADLKNYADTKTQAQILRETDEKRGSKP